MELEGVRPGRRCHLGAPSSRSETQFYLFFRSRGTKEMARKSHVQYRFIGLPISFITFFGAASLTTIRLVMLSISYLVMTLLAVFRVCTLNSVHEGTRGENFNDEAVRIFTVKMKMQEEWPKWYLFRIMIERMPVLLLSTVGNPNRLRIFVLLIIFYVFALLSLL